MIFPHAPFREAQTQMPETVKPAGQMRRERNRYFTIRPSQSAVSRGPALCCRGTERCGTGSLQDRPLRRGAGKIADQMERGVENRLSLSTIQCQPPYIMLRRKP